MQTDTSPSLNPQTAGGPGRPGPLSSAALVFFGGACYGFNATGADGFALAAQPRPSSFSPAA